MLNLPSRRLLTSLLPGTLLMMTCHSVQAEAGWEGFYIGLHAGYRWGDAEATFPRQTSPDHLRTLDYQLDTATVGLHGGYNFRTAARWLVGLDLNARYGSKSETGQFDTVSLDQFVKVETDWSGALRGRVAYLQGDGLIYVTGGIAVAGMEVHIDDLDAGVPDPTQSGSEREQMTGWTIGAGYDHMLRPNLILRLEYAYSDYGDEVFFRESTAAGNFPTELRYTSNAVTAGLSWKF